MNETFGAALQALILARSRRQVRIGPGVRNLHRNLHSSKTYSRMTRVIPPFPMGITRQMRRAADRAAA